MGIAHKPWVISHHKLCHPETLNDDLHAGMDEDRELGVPDQSAFPILSSILS